VAVGLAVAVGVAEAVVETVGVGEGEVVAEEVGEPLGSAELVGLGAAGEVAVALGSGVAVAVTSAARRLTLTAADAEVLGAQGSVTTPAIEVIAGRPAQIRAAERAAPTAALTPRRTRTELRIVEAMVISSHACRPDVLPRYSSDVRVL